MLIISHVANFHQLMSSFKQVSVFTNKQFDGNPVAVFFEADRLSTTEMQAIANWTNLSETTFVVKATDPKADYQLRIFTPKEELPFAGHPTIGSCHAVIEAGVASPSNGKIYQQCGAGLVELFVGDTISFQLPYFKISEVDATTIAEIEESLGFSGGECSSLAPPVLIDDGPKWLTINLASADLVNNLAIDFKKVQTVLDKNEWVGYSVFGKYKDGTYEARNFCPGLDVDEDPVCGSGAGADAAYLATFFGFRGHFDIFQGRHKGRDGRISVDVGEREGNVVITVGGNAVTAMTGTY